MLLSEEIQPGGAVGQDLRTLYSLDAYGNRIAAYQCSSDISNAQCLAHSGANQQQTGSTVLRYAKTNYDSVGRYSTGSAMPFYSAGTSGNWNEQQAISVLSRDEFGNAVQQHSINDTADSVTQFAQFGVLGRPYFTGDSTGKAATVTYRNCGAGTGQVTCSGDPRLKFRSQTFAAATSNGRAAPSSWTYFDTLGRPTLQITQSFDNNVAGKLFTAVCSYADTHNRPLYKSEPFFLTTVSALGDGSPNLGTTGTSPCSSAAYGTLTQYDVQGRVVNVIAPDQSMVTKGYKGLITSTMNQRGKTWQTSVNPLGEVVQSNDPGSVSGGGGDSTTSLVVTQSYFADGTVQSISRNAGNGAIVTSFVYDALGRKTQQTDLDRGTTSFTYNAAGDVISQQDAKGQIVTQSFDAMGRRWQRVASGGGNTITDGWTYDTGLNTNGVSGNAYGQVGAENHTATNGTSFNRTLTVDLWGRGYQRTTSIAGSIYTETTAFDAYGRPSQQQDATGQIVTTSYTMHGFTVGQSDSFIPATDASNTAGTLYTVLGMNERGQVVTEQRGSASNTLLQTQLFYDKPTGRLNQLCTGSGAIGSAPVHNNCLLQDLQYGFDTAGNLTTRTRAYTTETSPTTNLSTVEVLQYDALNRLITSTIQQFANSNTASTTVTQTMTFDALGNLCTQATTGGESLTYTYAGAAGCAGHGSSGSPDAVLSIAGTTNTSYQYDADGNQTYRTSDQRQMTYNALNQIATAKLGSNTTTFDYGPEGDRFIRNDNQGQTVTLYIGKVEIIKSNGALTEMRRDLGVAIDLIVSNDRRYTFSDHLGSVDAIAHADGTRVEAGSFDAWGNRRNPDTWAQAGSAPPLSTTTHGFTGHEHLDNFGFIHMNGRIYDPQLGKMLQADPVQNPGSQGLNRYSYVANNPLTLTDPTGYSWWGDILKTVVGAALIYFAPYLEPYVGSLWGAYAVAGFAAGVIQTGTLQGGVIGAFSAAIGYGIIQKFGSGLSWEGVLAHSAEGGVVSSLEGGKFGNGFFSAGVSAIFAPGVSELHNSGLQYVATALVGGTASVVSGGKFANGAESAVFQKAVSDGLDAAMQGYGKMDAQQQKLAYMSSAAYGDHPWQLAGLPYIDIAGTDGFAATEFIDEDGSTVVAFRGTRPSVWADWKNDGLQAGGFDSSQYDQTQKLAEQVYDQTGGNVIFTGHSLGGGEASAAAYWTGAAAVTFNAAGLNARYQGSIWQGPLNGAGGITNFHIVGDPLSTFQHFFPVPGAVGTQIALPAQQFERHSIANFWY